MVGEVYGVHLSSQEKGRLKKMIHSGRSSAQAVTRARILLKTDEGWTAPGWHPHLTCRSVRCAGPSADKWRRDWERCSGTTIRPPPHCKVDEKVEAHPVSGTGQSLIALACSPAPEGHDHWTRRLLADKTVELGLVESLPYETMRLHLKKTRSSRGGSSSGASPR